MYEHLCQIHNAPGGLGFTNVDALPEDIEPPSPRNQRTPTSSSSLPCSEPPSRLASSRRELRTVTTANTSPDPDGPLFPSFTPLKQLAESQTLVLTPGAPPPPDSPEEMADVSDNEEHVQYNPLSTSLFIDSSHADSSMSLQSPSACGDSDEEMADISDPDEEPDQCNPPDISLDSGCANSRSPSPLPPAQDRSSKSSNQDVHLLQDDDDDGDDISLPETPHPALTWGAPHPPESPDAAQDRSTTSSNHLSFDVQYLLQDDDNDEPTDHPPSSFFLLEHAPHERPPTSTIHPPQTIDVPAKQ